MNDREKACRQHHSLKPPPTHQMAATVVATPGEEQTAKSTIKQHAQEHEFLRVPFQPANDGKASHNGEYEFQPRSTTTLGRTGAAKPLRRCRNQAIAASSPAALWPVVPMRPV